MVNMARVVGVFLALLLLPFAAVASSPPSCMVEPEQTAFLRLIAQVVDSLREKQPGYVLCPHLTSKPAFEKEPQEFQRVSAKDLLVYSAFVERRAQAHGPAIRVLGTGLQQRFNRVGSHFCQLWYNALDAPISVGPALYQVIYPSLKHGDMWVSHFLICRLPDGYPELPYGVSVTATRCEPAANHVMVLNREPVNKTDTHGLCISPMYNKYNEWELLMEQIELHKLLGAAEIMVYNFSVSAKTAAVVQSYHDDPESNVRFTRWEFPVSIARKTNVWCQRGALNDCLYRLGHRHKYVTVTDMDEVLVPRREESWPGLIQRLHAAAPHTGAFLFQHAYFRRNATLPGPLPLITQSSFWRTDEVTPPGKIRCKSMYDTDKAIKIDLHFPYLLVPGAKELILEPEDGMLHHYRSSPMQTFQQNPEQFTYIEDRYMERYKERLTENVRRRLERIDFD